jgi:FkbM family methyltransferase
MKSHYPTAPPTPSFSQFGEDSLILKFFGGQTDGFFVEVGANDPENLSQTLLLERQGWRGILVEPLAGCCERLRAARPRSRVFQVACSSPAQTGTALLEVNDTGSKLTVGPAAGRPGPGCEEVQVLTLDAVLKEAGDPPLDFVSIDVEGFELEVLQGFSLERHRPKLLLIEDNLPNRLKVHRHLKQHGYRLVKRTGCNNWYVAKDQPFALSTPWERLKIYRKLYLGTAFRKFKAALTGTPLH